MSNRSISPRYTRTGINSNEFGGASRRKYFVRKQDSMIVKLSRFFAPPNSTRFTTRSTRRTPCNILAVINALTGTIKSVARARRKYQYQRPGDAKLGGREKRKLVKLPEKTSSMVHNGGEGHALSPWMRHPPSGRQQPLFPISL